MPSKGVEMWLSRSTFGHQSPSLANSAAGPGRSCRGIGHAAREGPGLTEAHPTESSGTKRTTNEERSHRLPKLYILRRSCQLPRTVTMADTI